MSQRIISTEPIQVAFSNPRRFQLTVQLIPSSIIAGNSGLVYGKWGSAPKADINSNTWDFVLNAGAVDGTNLYETRDKSVLIQDLWLIADTTNQIVNLIEVEVREDVPASPSGAAAT
jgi:hypothetical protein